MPEYIIVAGRSIKSNKSLSYRMMFWFHAMIIKNKTLILLCSVKLGFFNYSQSGCHLSHLGSRLITNLRLLPYFNILL
jgi:hypothetical protein